MCEKALRLGIPPEDLQKAMILIRNLRIQAIEAGLDPRATRIALIFGNLADLHFAQKRLSPRILKALKEIAQDLYNHARGSK